MGATLRMLSCLVAKRRLSMIEYLFPSPALGEVLGLDAEVLNKCANHRFDRDSPSCQVQPIEVEPDRLISIVR